MCDCTEQRSVCFCAREFRSYCLAPQPAESLSRPWGPSHPSLALPADHGHVPLSSVNNFTLCSHIKGFLLTTVYFSVHLETFCGVSLEFIA